MKQLIRYLKGTQHTCLRLESREMVEQGLLEIVGCSDSDWAGDSATRWSVMRFHCNAESDDTYVMRQKKTSTSRSEWSKDTEDTVLRMQQERSLQEFVGLEKKCLIEVSKAKNKRTLQPMEMATMPYQQSWNKNHIHDINDQE